MFVENIQLKVKMLLFLKNWLKIVMFHYKNLL